jgi:HD-like signal output (HDOD) protein/CheY-like chemotaxis protein
LPEILLVDDESRVLAGLRLATHLSEELWTLGWCFDGPGALDYLASHRVDVLVADVGTPGLNGASLLEEVRRRFPDTARVVLSDNADRDAIMSTAGSAQQFLSKSCDTEKLVATLDSILTARALVQDAELRSRLGGLESLPRPPEFYAELVALANRPESTVTEIAHLIERDLSTTAELLRLVNSSYFALPNEVTSVSRAVPLLGVNVIQTLVLAGQAFRPSRKLPADVGAADLAAQGIRAALSVRRTFKAAGWSEQAIGELSVAALLYDIGLLTLAANDAASWANYIKLKSRLPERDAQLCAFSCTSGRAGGYVLGLWGFHPNIVNAIAEQPIALDDDLAVAKASPAGLAIARAHQAAATDEALERSGP